MLQLQFIHSTRKRKMNMVKEGIEFILRKEFGITVGWVNKTTGKCEFIG